MSNTGSDGLPSELTRQREFLADSVPSYARALSLLESELPAGLALRLGRCWAGHQFTSFYERPLLLLASLRFAALTDGARHPLYPGLVSPAHADAITPMALRAALEDERVWRALEQRKVQTNETSRSVAWLWVATLIARQDPRAVFSLFDIGASAGLNLVGDQLPPCWSHSDGRALIEPMPALSITTRAGFDRCPLDATRADDARWLRACVWPGQTERMQRLETALTAFARLAETGQQPRVHQASARDVPSRLLSNASRPIAYQTLVVDYLEPSEREAYTTGMQRWLAAHPGAACWVELELLHDDSPPDRSAAIRVHVSDRSGHPRDFLLARCHPHPQVLHVEGEQVRAFSRWIES